MMTIEDHQATAKKLTVHYSLIQFFVIMGYCCVFSFSTMFLLSRGFTNSQIGITLTIANTFALIFNPLVAAFADKSTRIPLKNIVVVMLAGAIILSLLLFTLPVAPLLTAFMFVLLLGVFTTQVTLVTSMAMEHINTGVPINFSLARGIGSFGYAGLCLAMGFWVDDYGAPVVMLVNIAISLVGIILVLSFKKADRSCIRSAAEETQATSLLEFIWHNKRFMAVVLSSALLFFSHVIINTYLIQIVEHVGGNSSDMGISIAISGFLELPAMALFPLIFRKLRKAGLIMKLAGTFLIIKALIILIAPSVFWIDISQCFQFFAYAMFLPASVYYVNQVIRDADKVKGQSIMSMFIGISGIIGNLLGGLMLDTSGGVSYMLTVGSIVSLMGLVLLIFTDNFKVADSEKLAKEK